MKKKHFQSLLRRHARMLFDWERTAPLLKAIARQVAPGDVVVDLGCGLGFLSFAACHAGAKRVYAIDVDSEAIAFAQEQAVFLGFGKKIVFLNDHSGNIDLPSRADLLIQETIGPLGFDENFLPTLQDAKKRFLKPVGGIIPESVALFAAPVDQRNNFLAPSQRMSHVVTRRSKILEIRIQEKFRLSDPKHFHGILLWPQIIWERGLKTDASPKNPPTHWAQTFFRAPKNTRPTPQLHLDLILQPDPAAPLYYSRTDWRIHFS